METYTKVENYITTSIFEKANFNIELPFGWKIGWKAFFPTYYHFKRIIQPLLNPYISYFIIVKLENIFSN